MHQNELKCYDIWILVKKTQMNLKAILFLGLQPKNILLKLLLFWGVQHNQKNTLY